jgi:hypothetical protein
MLSVLYRRADEQRQGKVLGMLMVYLKHAQRCISAWRPGTAIADVT